MKANPARYRHVKTSCRYVTEKIAKTVSVTTSWIVFSSAAEYTLDPNLFAGTAKQYSTSAIPHDTAITIANGLPLNFKCPYQANVMNTFEMTSSTTGET